MMSKDYRMPARSVRQDKRSAQPPQASPGGAGLALPEAAPQRTGVGLWLAAALVFCWACASAWLLRGGVKHPEADTYLPYHLSAGPLFQKLFDSRVLDGNMFQARELSYLFDHWDCAVIAWSAHAGFPHFMSATFLLFTLALVLCVWWFCRRDLRLGVFPTAALTALFLTAPCVLLSGSYFRSAKIGAALCTVLFAIALFRYARNPGRTFRRAAAACVWLLALGFVAMRFDRQAVFMLGMALFGLLVWAVASRDGRALVPGLPILAALAADAAYNFGLAPRLTWAANGYWPNYDYQALPLGDFLGHIGRYLSDGFGLAADTMRFFAGNLPRACALLLFGGACWAHWASRRLRPAEGQPRCAMLIPFAPVLIGLGLFALAVLLNALMVCRHSALLWEDVRRSYYWLPLTALWLVFAAVTLQRVQEAALVPRYVLNAALCLLVIGNLAAIPKHVDVLRHGHIGGDLSACLLKALRMRKIATAALPPAVANHGVYRLLKTGANRFNAAPRPILVVENERWCAEIQYAESNRSAYAFVPVDRSASAGRGSVIRASPSLTERSGLWGAMRLKGDDGVAYRFSPRPVQPAKGNLYLVKALIRNKTGVSLPFRVGSLSVTEADGKPLALAAVGLDSWLFSKATEADRAGALARTVPIAGGHSQPFFYAFEGADTTRSFDVKLEE